MDRAICAASSLHQADQALRRMVSQTMKSAKGTTSKALFLFSENSITTALHRCYISKMQHDTIPVMQNQKIFLLPPPHCSSLYNLKCSILRWVLGQ